MIETTKIVEAAKRRDLLQRRKPNKLILKLTLDSFQVLGIYSPHIFNVSKDSIDLSLLFLNLLPDIVRKVAIECTISV